MDYIDVVMDYIDVNGCIKDKNYFHSLPTSSREFFTLCVRILGIIAKEKAPHEKDVWIWKCSKLDKIGQRNPHKPLNRSLFSSGLSVQDSAQPNLWCLQCRYLHLN